MILGIDWGSSTGLALLTLDGQRVMTRLIERAAPHKARAAKTATKRHPAIPAIPELTLTQAWGRYTTVLRQTLLDLVSEYGVSVIALEDPGALKGRDQLRSYYRCFAVVEEVAGRCRAEFVQTPTGRVKMTATGFGRAEKPAMIATAEARWGVGGLSEHEADALWIAETARRGAE